jgi:hypothetical protein
MIKWEYNHTTKRKELANNRHSLLPRKETLSEDMIPIQRNILENECNNHDCDPEDPGELIRQVSYILGWKGGPKCLRELSLCRNSSEKSVVYLINPTFLYM